MTDRRIVVGITHGDINGTSYELLLKLFNRHGVTDLFTPIIYGSPRIAAYYSKALQMERASWHLITDAKEAEPNVVNVIDVVGDEIDVTPGLVTEAAGIAALAALERATSDINHGAIDVLVTCPINKSAMPQDRFPYKGHTAYLGVACGQGKEPLMILAAPSGLRVALVSTHDPICQVSQVITQRRVLKTLEILDETLRRDFLISSPRIAVLGLNPHAGDNGLIGSEELEVIAPSIAIAQREMGIYAFGPFSADGFWGSGAYQQYDAVLAMYHDQGLAPFKLLHLHDGVNVTAGLPIIRTSPDHGTGYDIVMQGIANEQALMESIYMAIDLYRHRIADDEARSNVLPKLYKNRRGDNE
ncbi:4-hydroxythreonine-4-phosphate dehydrogenase PdxA [uncultured Porphyromonas sp.]|uniref:4-hydroxythreonine-4-phosphate dehydrogenase PdxA n=1 Tax=uncultured Porphyromonas sp. TaxID=159274 RepID=UPI002634B36F|nr:4-hydroxythreonine-4-phosphate dehydrogenase PdxA [uncultured Porphyromonas sp.]